MRLFLIIKAVVAFLVTFSPAWGHSGRTDSSGGHHSRYGGYHFHHGLEPHQHPNGVCPHFGSQDEKVDALSRIKNPEERGWLIVSGFFVVCYGAFVLTERKS